MNKTIFTPQILRYDDFRDLEIIKNISQGWDILWTYIKAGGTDASIWVFTTPRMQFSKVLYNNAIMIESSPPVGSVQLSFIRTKGACSSHNQKLKDNELLVIYSGEETNYVAGDANEIFNLVFEKDFFDDIFYRYFDRHVAEMRSEYRLSMREDGINSFILKIQYWQSYFQQNISKKMTVDTFFRIENDIAEHLFSLIDFKAKRKEKNRFDTLRARKILEENIDNIYSISDLVDEMGINARTLQIHFKDKLGVTPKRYLQNIRLNAIRRELLKADPKSTVISDIALKYGFFYPSHFATEYKKLFLQTPTDTLYI
jgi:AraC-like DNA-binding protein